MIEGDNVINNIKTLKRIFPYLNDINKTQKLLIDKESIHFISLKEDAEQISQIICECLQKHNKVALDCVITDATAGVGGNVISFSQFFKKIYAIEIDNKRCEYLINNLKIYDITNVEIINGNCTEYLSQIEDHDVVYADVPWGGTEYKESEILRLNFCNQSIENFCLDLLKPQIMKKVPLLIVMKLPKNYDIPYFFKRINEHNKPIYFYDLKKMFVLVILNKID